MASHESDTKESIITHSRYKSDKEDAIEILFNNRYFLTTTS